VRPILYNFLRSYFWPVLCVTKFIIFRDMLSHFAGQLKSDPGVQQTHVCGRWLNKGSFLAPALGVTKFKCVRYLILVTLCWAT
jgi:hypothetical protein